MDPLKREIQVQVCRPTAGDWYDGGISVLYNCLSWYKFVNAHLYHSRQLYNIHIAYRITLSEFARHFCCLKPESHKYTAFELRCVYT